MDTTRIETCTSYVCRICGDSFDTQEQAKQHDEEMRRVEETFFAEAEMEFGPYIGKDIPVFQPRRYPTPGDGLVLSGKRSVRLVGLKLVGSYGCHHVALVVEPGVPQLTPCGWSSDYTVDLETTLVHGRRIENGALWLSSYDKDYDYLEGRAEEWEKTGRCP